MDRDRLAKQNTHVGERAFFQIAVALIPLLTFGGFLISRPQQDDRHWPPPVAISEIFEGMAIVLLGLFAIVAETTAIRGAVTGHTTSVDRLIVVTMILVGMVAIVVRAAAPRVARILKFSAGAKHPQRQRWALALIAILAIGLVILTIDTLNNAIRLGEGEARLHHINRLTVAIEASYRRLDAIHRRENAILLKLAPLSTKGTKLSRTEVVEQRILTGEFKAAVRAGRLETSRLLRLVRQQNGFYEHPIPP